MYPGPMMYAIEKYCSECPQRDEILYHVANCEHDDASRHSYWGRFTQYRKNFIEIGSFYDRKYSVLTNSRRKKWPITPSRKPKWGLF